MLKRITRGWAFAKSSWSVLHRYPILIILPIISIAPFLLVSGLIIVSVVLGGSERIEPILTYLTNTEFGKIELYAIFFGFYFVNMFIVIFFNAALFACSTANGPSGRWRGELSTCVMRIIASAALAGSPGCWPLYPDVVFIRAPAVSA